jgi:hypothetical protein
MEDLENDTIDGIIEKPKVKKEQTEKQKNDKSLRKHFKLRFSCG